MGIKVLIVGASSSTGLSIYQKLSQFKEIEVTSISRTKNNKLPKNTVYGDLLDEDFCNKQTGFAKYDFIIYLCGVWKGKRNEIEDYNDNLLPFKNFISSFAKDTKNIIYFSSSAVYKNNKFGPESKLFEDPYSSYGKAKLECENILMTFCKTKKIGYSILRPFHIVSYNERYKPGSSHVFTDFYYQANNDLDCFQKKMMDLPDVWISFTLCEDIAELIKKILFSSIHNNEIYNIGSSKTFSIRHLGDAIIRFLKNNLNIKDPNYEARCVEYFNKSIKDYGNYSDRSLNEMVEIFIKNKTNQDDIKK